MAVLRTRLALERGVGATTQTTQSETGEGLQAPERRLHTVLVLREIEPPQNHNRLISEIALDGFIRRMTRMGRVMHR